MSQESQADLPADLDAIGYLPYVPTDKVRTIEQTRIEDAEARALTATEGKPITVTHNNATEIFPNLWLGDWDDAFSFDGATLNLRDNYTYPGMTYHVEMMLPNPINWKAKYCISRLKLDAASDIIESHQQNGSGLLVHCLFGKERSPLAIAWWMVKSGRSKTLEEGISYLQSKRPIVENRIYWIEDCGAPSLIAPRPPLLIDGIEAEIGNHGALSFTYTVEPFKCPIIPFGCPEPALTLPTNEQLKYEMMWARDNYRIVAPGEGCAQVFLEIAKPKPDCEVIDFGAGTGRGALMLAIMGNFKKVHMLDFASNCLDEDVRNALETQSHIIDFQQHDLNKPAPVSAQYGYCTDVLEHIPPAEVDGVLLNIMRAAQHVFFQIACEDDICGAEIGEKLHLSVHPYAWWLAKLQSLEGVVHWSRDFGTHCMFYVTAWLDAKKIVDYGVLNIDEQRIIDNVNANLDANWQEVSPHPTNDTEIMILGGGPSLNSQLDDIKALKAAGVKVVTLNGAYHWALEHDLGPVNQIVVDAREFNARFTKPVSPGCKYFISSQCHPSVLEGLPHADTYLWHTTMDSIRETLAAKRELWFGIPGGSTVMLRAIPMLRLLGFKKMHLFGFDSCILRIKSVYSDGTDTETHTTDHHHSYKQPENDKQPIIATTVGDRVFQCHPWMISQAQEFMDLIRFLGDEIELEVYGDGLIAHILATGAKMFNTELGGAAPLA